MAVQTILEKGSGDTNSFTLPVYVYDDVGATLTMANAILAAEAAAPSQVIGIYQDGVPSVDQVKESVWRVQVRYSVGDAAKVFGTERDDYSAQAETLHVMYAPQVARFAGTAPDFAGMIQPGGRELGATIPPGAQNLGKSLRMNIALFTPGYRKSLINLVRAGAVNSTAIAGYAAGELQLVSLSAQQDGQVTYQVRLGWSYKPNVSGTTYGAVSGVSHQGHDFVWVLPEKKTDRNNNTLYEIPQFVYVNRPRITGDLSVVGVTPPPIA